MSQLLEDKVSNLMASVKDLKAEIVALNETAEEHEKEKQALREHIQ